MSRNVDNNLHEVEFYDTLPIHGSTNLRFTNFATIKGPYKLGEIPLTYTPGPNGIEAK